MITRRMPTQKPWIRTSCRCTWPARGQRKADCSVWKDEWLRYIRVTWGHDDIADTNATDSRGVTHMYTPGPYNQTVNSKSFSTCSRNEAVMFRSRSIFAVSGVVSKISNDIVLLHLDAPIMYQKTFVAGIMVAKRNCRELVSFARKIVLIAPVPIITIRL